MRKTIIKYGKIVNGEFVVIDNMIQRIDINEAKNIEYDLRDKAFDRLSPLSSLANDHYVISAEIYSPRGKLKEVHIIRDNNYVTDAEFAKFIRPYNYIGAIHR